MNKIVIVGFAQATTTCDFYNLISETHKVEVLHPDELLAGNYPDDCEFLISVTRDKSLRELLIEYLDQHLLPRTTYIHPSAIVNTNAVIGNGSFIAPFASVFDGANVAKDCIIGPYAMISHKSTIGQGSIVHPGVMVAGSTQIGKYCLLGIRSTVIDKLEICNNVVVGAGSLVTKNITIPGNYVGTPARKVS